MAIDSKHPQYDEFIKDWSTLRDLYRGERVVKDKREEYLPGTAGMHLDGMGTERNGKPQPGKAAYDAYLKRAVFHDYIRDGVESLVGQLHQKAATFELPEAMKPLEEECTLSGESLLDLLRRINTEQVLEGRVGLLADLPAQVPTEKQGSVLPYIALYITESIINWDESEDVPNFAALNLVVLNESGLTRSDGDGFNWKGFKQYRVLQLGDIKKNEMVGEGVFLTGLFSDLNGSTAVYSQDAMIMPTLRGTPLKEVPFVFINTKDLVTTPDDPPLQGLGRLTLAIYRGEADYRQNLFMQGQDTFVTIGGVRRSTGDGTEVGDEPLRMGAGSRVDIEMGGDAKYVGVSGEGLAEQREALVNDKRQAEAKAGKLISAGDKDAESGEALKTRVTAQTATLNQIANTGAKGLENILKIIGRWMGLAESMIDTIKVTPNLEFADFDLKTQDILDLTTARSMGAPISRRSIHGIMVERGMTTLSFEEEMEMIEEENAQMPPAPGTPGGPDPAVDPHLTDEDGAPLNKDQLSREGETRAEKRQIRQERRETARGTTAE